jgi:hypothetical protein
MALACGLLGFKARAFVAAVAERLVFRMSVAAEVYRRELVLLIFFAVAIEQLGSAFNLIGTISQHTNDYISHGFLLLVIVASRPTQSMT